MQLGHNVEAIIGCVFTGFDIEGENSKCHLLVNFGFYLQNLSSVQGGQLVNSPTANSLNVVGNPHEKLKTIKHFL